MTVTSSALKHLRDGAMRAMVMTSVGLIVMIAVAFMARTDAGTEHNLRADTNSELYTLTDSFQDDPDGFSSFRSSPAAMATLSSFYRKLQESPLFRNASTFAQPLFLTDFRGTAEFEDGYGSERGARGAHPGPAGVQVRDIASVQMNEAAAAFYGVRTDDGRPWRPSDASDLARRRVGVLLGSRHAGTYKVGDVMRGYYYSLPFEFHVVGFLEERSAIYYKGDLNYSLDRSVVVPYPRVPYTPSSPEEDYFNGILLFAMINGDLVVPGGTSLERVSSELTNLSARSGFKDFTILGVPSYLTQVSQTRQLIYDNKILVLALVVALIGCAGLVVLWTALSEMARFTPLVRILHARGESHGDIARRIHYAALPGYILAVVGYGLAVWWLPSTTRGAVAAGATMIAVAVAVHVLTQRSILSHRIR